MKKFIANSADSSGKEGVEVYLTEISSKRICLTIQSSGDDYVITTLDKDGLGQLISALQEAHSNMTE